MCLIYQGIGYQIYATIVGFYIPFMVMIFVYYKIYHAARRITHDEKRIQNYLEKLLNEGQEGEPIAAARCSIIRSMQQKGKKLGSKIFNHFKATTIIGILVFAFTVCCMPYFVLALTRLAIQTDDNIDVLNTMSLLFLWFGFLNSLADPIINATMHPEFRKPIHEMLRCRCYKMSLVIRSSIYRRSFVTPDFILERHSSRTISN